MSLSIFNEYYFLICWNNKRKSKNFGLAHQSQPIFSPRENTWKTSPVNCLSPFNKNLIFLPWRSTLINLVPATTWPNWYLRHPLLRVATISATKTWQFRPSQHKIKLLIPTRPIKKIRLHPSKIHPVLPPPIKMTFTQFQPSQHKIKLSILTHPIKKIRLHPSKIHLVLQPLIKMIPKRQIKMTLTRWH